ncbi:MAG: hypothetical protein HZA52_16805 [Planctomycetes bacterium]|nr:hypothetical protein [Planctomycetota bacterium]
MPFPFDVRSVDEAPTPEPAPEVRPVSYRGPDRRNRPTPRFSRFTFLGGRRRKPRRESELEGAFVDQYSGRLLVLLCWIAVMNSADSFFTLVHLQNGGIELNPVAGAMLGLGRLGFVTMKGTLITIPLLVLCQHKNFAIARAGLWLASGAYTLLLAYHLSLL